jgi:glycosyltransferase involved in cell wall biosynthesis
LLNDKCGILIEVENKQQMIQDFTNAIVKLYENPILREEMGRNAQERAKKFTWEEKGRFMNGVYEKLVSER